MRVLLAAAACLLAIAVAAGGAAYWTHRSLHSPGPLVPGGALVAVAPGDSFAATVRQLEDSGILRHGWLLRLYARHHGSDRGVRAGDFHFDGPISPVELLAALAAGPTAHRRVTVREGLNLRQVTRLLDESGFGAADEFLCLAHDAGFLADLALPATGLEGYLFPDTYDFTWAQTPEAILRAMVQRFRSEAARLEVTRRARGISEEDMVTLAAIIEKETGVAEERATVAAVFHNRLRVGMRLQSDPTAIYPWKEGVPTAADVRRPSPYNTYTNDGLPPGPICNPGAASLRAALEPADVDYLYFVSRGDGTHAFSRTLAEHNRNVAALRRARR